MSFASHPFRLRPAYHQCHSYLEKIMSFLTSPCNDTTDQKTIYSVYVSQKFCQTIFWKSNWLSILQKFLVHAVLHLELVPLAVYRPIPICTHLYLQIGQRLQRTFASLLRSIRCAPLLPSCWNAEHIRFAIVNIIISLSPLRDVPIELLPPRYITSHVQNSMGTWWRRPISFRPYPWT